MIRISAGAAVCRERAVGRCDVRVGMCGLFPTHKYGYKWKCLPSIYASPLMLHIQFFRVD